MIDSHSSQTPRNWPHLMAVLLVCATFPLIWVGGLVTTYDAGMAVPDWPSTYGYNLFLYPWQTWILGPFDLFIEHGHRLLGAVVGLIAIVTLVVTWRCDSRRWVTGMAAGLLALVIFQGGLGGLRVIENEVALARIHGIVGPAFFAFAVAFAVITSNLWRRASRQHASGGSKLQRLAALTAGITFIQLIIGAHLRHLPLDWSPYAFRAVLVFHLFVAAALLFHAVMLTIRVATLHRDNRALLYPAVAISLLVLTQIGLGSATWIANYSWPNWATELGFGVGHTIVAGSYASAMIVTAHQAMGSLILGVAVMLSIRAFRLFTTEASLPSPSVSLKGVLA